ncbi:hypothetical protein HK101_003509 [Irineochytrium annulatum]|nr:hypothetical protein HK101_003509 [Irineochytrium annulatum]
MARSFSNLLHANKVGRRDHIEEQRRRAMNSLGIASSTHSLSGSRGAFKSTQRPNGSRDLLTNNSSRTSEHSTHPRVYHSMVILREEVDFYIIKTTAKSDDRHPLAVSSSSPLSSGPTSALPSPPPRRGKRPTSSLMRASGAESGEKGHKKGFMGWVKEAWRSRSGRRRKGKGEDEEELDRSNRHPVDADEASLRLADLPADDADQDPGAASRSPLGMVHQDSSDTVIGVDHGDDNYFHGGSGRPDEIRPDPARASTPGSDVLLSPYPRTEDDDTSARSVKRDPFMLLLRAHCGTALEARRLVEGSYGCAASSLLSPVSSPLASSSSSQSEGVHNARTGAQQITPLVKALGAYSEFELGGTEWGYRKVEPATVKGGTRLVSVAVLPARETVDMNGLEDSPEGVRTGNASPVPDGDMTKVPVATGEQQGGGAPEGLMTQVQPSAAESVAQSASSATDLVRQLAANVPVRRCWWEVMTMQVDPAVLEAGVEGKDGEGAAVGVEDGRKKGMRRARSETSSIRRLWGRFGWDGKTPEPTSLEVKLWVRRAWLAECVPI